MADVALWLFGQLVTDFAESIRRGSGLLRPIRDGGVMPLPLNFGPERNAGAIVNQRIVLLFFVVLVVGGGLVVGYLTKPGQWYAQLAKPAFTPAGWLFGPVWTALYLMIGVAGWRIWRTDRLGRPMKLWWAQLVLNFLWSPVFFAVHQIGLALVVIFLILVAILAFIATSWRQDRAAAWLFVPYATWVAFATVLNASVFALN